MPRLLNRELNADEVEEELFRSIFKAFDIDTDDGRLDGADFDIDIEDGRLDGADFDIDIEDGRHNGVGFKVSESFSDATLIIPLSIEKISCEKILAIDLIGSQTI